jgi:regulatory protein
VIVQLERSGWFSERRFVEQLAGRRAARFGAARIAAELREHRIGAELTAPVLASLRASELERAWALWLRRYGQPPADTAQRARQQRFLAQRGFSSDAVRQVMRRAVAAAPAADSPG